MLSLHFREQLPEMTAAEFDFLIAKLKAFLLLEHNEDGSHRLFLNAGTVNSNDTLGANLLEAEGHWWRKGPWLFDDPRATDKHIVGLRPPDPPAGTINNYAPDGIDTAVLVEIEPLGDITLTGLKAPTGREKRLIILRNRDSSNTITLTHADTASLEQNRFDLPDSASLELGPGQAAWLYWDPGRAAYSLIITSHQAGGSGAIIPGIEKKVELTLDYTDVGTLASVPIEIIPAVPGYIIFVFMMVIEQAMGATLWTAAAPTVGPYFASPGTVDQQLSSWTAQNTADRYELHCARRVTSMNTGVNFEPENVGIELRAVVDRAGGSGTYKFTIFYELVTHL